VQARQERSGGASGSGGRWLLHVLPWLVGIVLLRTATGLRDEPLAAAREEPAPLERGQDR
jgi:hypothetical protein